jgi:hypothetical protein
MPSLLTAHDPSVPSGHLPNFVGEDSHFLTHEAGEIRGVLDRGRFGC